MFFNLRLFADDSNIIHTFPADQGEIYVDKVINNKMKSGTLLINLQSIQ